MSLTRLVVVAQYQDALQVHVRLSVALPTLPFLATGRQQYQQTICRNSKPITLSVCTCSVCPLPLLNSKFIPVDISAHALQFPL